jgi:hypothetical protein
MTDGAHGTSTAGRACDEAGSSRYNSLAMFTVTFSRRLAVFAGFGLPAFETWRRWREWPGPIENWIPWADDYFLGAILLIAAWLSRPRPSLAAGNIQFSRVLRVRRASWLIAGWGFVCGAGFGSVLVQFNYIINPALGDYDEPSGLADEWMVVIKASLLAIGFIGLLASMRDQTVPVDRG